MPRKSDRQKVLEGMETALVGSLWKMKMADQKSKAVQTNPTHQLTFDFLIAAILRMKNPLPEKHQLLHINIALVNYHLKKSAIKLHDDILQSRLQRTKYWVSVLLKLIDQLSSACYSVPRVPRPRIATISKTYEVLTSTSEEVFMIYARMTRKSFFSLADAIKNHYIFYNNSTNPQAPAEMQLLVALSHLGLYGNGGSPHVLAQYYNISVTFFLSRLGGKLHKSLYFCNNRDLGGKTCVLA
ncbi:hypothetical protein PSTG_11794 [Puccinia striiformis f. sp. tritici PST-78]|uniref:Uncharacterized protein n=1 Tax=Puccinia striiformis f. sp. tritici PST-78 TaxID=1165861 RepID=A0A0L0V7C3_9BASI|nr:hypothetical protein PSTG_11794 [Puccinia striiformis f. sp. tritici PST-78]